MNSGPSMDIGGCRMVMMIAGLAFLLSLLFPGFLRSESRVLFEGDSIYGHITVTEEDRERCLFESGRI